MKTMIFVGSPNQDGNTMKLVNALIKDLKGSIEIINVFDYLDVAPCIDCKYCHTNYGCIYKDKFNDILERSFSVDAFVIATPLWFGNVSGPMMAFFSRLQTITSAHIYRHDMTHKFDKAGILLVSSKDKWHNMAKVFETTVEFVFNHFDALIISEVYAFKTRQVQAMDAKHDHIKVKRAAKLLNEWYEDKTKGNYYRYGYASENYIRLEANDNIKEQ